MVPIRVDLSDTGDVGESFLSKYPGICPLCSRFIAKNRSKVIFLPRPMTPRSGDGRFSDDDNKTYYYDGRLIGMQPRKVAHEDCWNRWQKSGFAPPKYAGTVRWD